MQNAQNLMSSFEFIAALMSIIIGLGVTNLLAGAGRAFYRRKENPLDEVHIVLTVATLLLLAVGMSGCSSAGFSAQDVNLQASGNTLYLLARSGNVSRNLCASLGGDVARAEGRSAAVEGRTIQLDRVVGCHTVRHIIVCTDEDAACLAHEERHRLEGAFHR